MPKPESELPENQVTPDAASVNLTEGLPQLSEKIAGNSFQYSVVKLAATAGPENRSLARSAISGEEHYQHPVTIVD